MISKTSWIDTLYPARRYPVKEQSAEFTESRGNDLDGIDWFHMPKDKIHSRQKGTLTMPETTKEELEALKSDLAELRKDLKGLARAVKDSGYKQANRIRARAEDSYHSAVAQGEETLEKGREEIREHPFTTVLGALLVGFGIGVLLERK